MVKTMRYPLFSSLIDRERKEERLLTGMMIRRREKERVTR